MNELKYQFETIATLYDKIRPKPPLESMNIVENFAKSGKNSRVLEVGVGTGQATEEIADIGCEVVGLELGTELTNIAQQQFASYPNVNIINTSFEDWQPEPATLDVFQCVQAFHWINTGWGLKAITTNLKPKGSLAIVWHLDHSSNSDFNKASQHSYDQYNHLMVLPNQENTAIKSRPSPNNWQKVHKAIVNDVKFENTKLHRIT